VVGAAERGEGLLGAKSFGVVSCGDQQGSGCVRADSVGGEQLRVGCGEDVLEVGVETGELVVEVHFRISRLLGHHSTLRGVTRARDRSTLSPHVDPSWPSKARL
jgi:hypothetical protein